jgi:inorganic pyrophosphatase
VKYEVDKLSGHLRVDRPQKYSALCPALYGFVPRTLCGDAVGAFAASRAARVDVAGDGDPMDVCVLTEREINRGGIIVTARPIGGFRMFDGSRRTTRSSPCWRVTRPAETSAISATVRPRSWSASAIFTYKDVPARARREITHVYGARYARSCATRSGLPAPLSTGL